jgi:NAD(P)-dependent dehydrogenase (short-subunit alcohol dehydrogenase family)
LAEADEIARWVWHLVDRRAEWVTGSVLTVDGGRLLGPPAVS